MTKTILFRSLAPTVAFAAFTLFVLAPSPVTAEDKSQDKSLVGTWSGTFNDPFVGQVLVLTTYNFGGTAVATTGSPADSEQHGVWERTGAREFAATLLGYTRDPSGKVIGKLRIRVRTTLSQDRNA